MRWGAVGLQVKEPGMIRLSLSPALITTKFLKVPTKRGIPQCHHRSIADTVCCPRRSQSSASSGPIALYQPTVHDSCYCLQCCPAPAAVHWHHTLPHWSLSARKILQLVQQAGFSASFLRVPPHWRTHHLMSPLGHQRRDRPTSDRVRPWIYNDI